MATDADESGFLSRWARRKAQVREGKPVDEAAVSPVMAPPAVARPAVAPAPVAPLAETAETQPVKPPAPTLADVAALNRDSDYSRFVASGVDPTVKNAALGKLFSDPHFNVMDGLDTYIDDYGKPDPIPTGMLRQMVQSKMLGLFSDEEDPDPAAAGPADPLTPAKAAESPPDEDTALRLQPDDDAGHGGAAPGAGEDPGRQH